LRAFEPVDNELDWSLVYPELATGVKGPARPKAEAVSDLARNVIQKLDAMKDAKIDGELMSSLGNSIKILSQLQKYCSNS
jgi:gliding motility-associated protein GldL